MPTYCELDLQLLLHAWNSFVGKSPNALRVQLKHVKTLRRRIQRSSFWRYVHMTDIWVFFLFFFHSFSFWLGENAEKYREISWLLGAEAPWIGTRGQERGDENTIVLASPVTKITFYFLFAREGECTWDTSNETGSWSSQQKTNKVYKKLLQTLKKARLQSPFTCAISMERCWTFVWLNKKNNIFYKVVNTNKYFSLH